MSSPEELWDSEITPEEDYYRILGLEDGASPEEVRSAYRDLVRQYHPDAGLMAGTSLLFRRIQQAYETLRDLERRQEYDAALRRKGMRPPLLLDINLTLGPTQLLSLDEVQLLYVLIKITPIGQQPVPRTPLNLALVIDRSTSMKGERLSAVREATLSLVNQLEPEDTFSLVSFSDRSEVKVQAQRQPDKRALRTILQALHAGGGTELYQGLMAGLSEVRRAWSDQQINHVILLTDGHTYGDAEKCLRAAQAAAQQNIGISCIGIGNDWNEDFLDHLSAAGGGMTMYIERADNLGEAFERRLRDLKDAWIPDMTLNLQYDPRATHKEIFSIAPELMRLSEYNGQFMIGPLQRTDERLLLLEVLVSPMREGRHRLLQVEIQGSVPASGGKTRRRRAVWVECTASHQTRPLMPNTIIEAAQRVNMLRLQERAFQEAQQGKLAAASQRLQTVATHLLHAGQGELASAFQEEADRLLAAGSFTRGSLKKLRYGTRSLVWEKGENDR